MGLFSRNDEYNENYNVGLKNEIDKYLISLFDSKKRVYKSNKLNKYAKIKLKNEKNLHDEQVKALEGLLGRFKGRNIINYDESFLRSLHLSGDEFNDFLVNKNEDLKDQILNGKKIFVVFPKIKVEKEITNNKGKNALVGGLLFGTTGAVIGAAMGSTMQKTTEKLVPGESGKLKVAKKGIVLTTIEETVKIPWSNIKGMEDNRIEFREGKHMKFYKVHHHEILSEIINEKAQYKDDDGW